MLRVRAEDQVTSLYGALGNFLTSNGLSLGDVRRVVLTGVGASYVDGDVFGLPTCRVDEFQASGTGALALSGQTSGVVVTMGTGTAFLWAEAGKEVRHLCGSGIGGGTLLLIYMTAFAGIPQTLAQGINLLYFLPTAATALPAHIKNGYIDRGALLPAILTGLAGTALAAWAATALDVELLHRCFGGFLIVIGLRELFSKPAQGDQTAG